MKAKEYALYKGDTFLCIGTMKEIAKQRNITLETVRFYRTRAYKKRVEKRKNSKNAMILIKIPEDDE